MPRVQFPPERIDDVLKVVVELLRERGFERLTIDAVAIATGASKATLYRHWSSKQELFVAAVQRNVSREWSVPANGSFRDDVLSGLRLAASALAANGMLLQSLAEAARHDPLLLAESRRHISAPHEQMWTEIVRRWRNDPQLRGRTNLDWLTELCESLLSSRLLPTSAPLSDADLVRFTDEVLLPLFLGAPSNGSA
jgi:AcrR family transcriptional regulator